MKGIVAILLQVFYLADYCWIYKETAENRLLGIAAE